MEEIGRRHLINITAGWRCCKASNDRSIIAAKSGPAK
jgi:hypothetical protein